MTETADFCRAEDDNTCVCGKAGLQVLECKKPFSPSRMQAIFDKLLQSQEPLGADFEAVWEPDKRGTQQKA